MRVLVTRPAQDAKSFAAHLSAMGHAPLIAPLLSVRFHDGAPLELDDIAGILATSANGVRALARRTARRDLPVYAVGPQTARAARQAGFKRVENAAGDAQALARAVPRWAASGTLLHAAGAGGAGKLAALLGAEGFSVRTAILYEVHAATALPDPVSRALGEGSLDAAFFFSPRSALVFAECVRTAGLGAACGRLAALCISAATAAALSPLDFAAFRIAARPDQEALLACLD